MISPTLTDNEATAAEIKLTKQMRQARRRIKRQSRAFITAVEQQRPKIQPDKLLIDFENISHSNTAGLVKLAMRSLAFTSAATYAGEELNNQLNAEDISFRIAEIDMFSRRLVRIAILRRMLRVFRLPKDISRQIINLQIVKDFGNGTSSVPPRLPAISPAPVSRGKLSDKSSIKNPFLPEKKPQKVREKAIKTDDW
jgi:hypothetical protein